MDDKANKAALLLARRLGTKNFEGVEEVVPALASVFVRFDTQKTSPVDLSEQLSTLALACWTEDFSRNEQSRLWHIPACYDPELAGNLSEAASLAGLTMDQAVKSLSTTELRVLAIGFAPGQPYLGQFDKEWDIPRLVGVTPSVPAGALVVAVRQFVLFDNPSPTGWRHVGQTAFRCFRPETTDPFPLRAGDRVLFPSVSLVEFDTLAASPTGGAVMEAAQ